MSVFLVFMLLCFIASTAGLWKIFQKAGYRGWEVLIPFYNFYIWLKVIKKPLWWFIFIVFPYINVFTLMLMYVETAKCFKKYGLLQQGLAAVLPFIYLPYLGFSAKESYTHPDNLLKMKKTVVREWTDAIIFAVIAATIIRTFLLEAYTIPTPSMEKSLLVGDFLFVSKYAYGPKVPNTPLSFPFAHHTLPFTKSTKSYLEWITLPLYRLPGLGNVQRNDAVVFNYPDGDTTTVELQSNYSYYALVREHGRDAIWNKAIPNPIDMEHRPIKLTVIARPVDKRENFIKRCVAIAGDTLEIINQDVYINGEKMIYGKGIELIFSRSTRSKNEFDPNIFPYKKNYPWNVDNYGPLYIPKEGATVKIDTSNICLYERIISAYEGNDLKIKDGKIYINNEIADSYTFNMNYYWLMGDNRHNSADSRYWGFVPEDHVVGKAVFVWLSLDNTKSLFNGKIRWNKMFRIVR